MREETGARTQGIEQIVAALITSRSEKTLKPSMRGEVNSCITRSTRERDEQVAAADGMPRS